MTSKISAHQSMTHDAPDDITVNTGLLGKELRQGLSFDQLSRLIQMV